MATCTLAVGTADTTNGASYTSGAFTPAAGDLLVVFVSSAASAINGTLTGTDVPTFTRIAGRVKNASADRLGVFIADSFCTAVSQTVTFDCTGDDATGCIIHVYRVSGMSRAGASASLQTAGESNQTIGQPSPSFASSANTSNPTLGAVFKSENSAITEPTNWTEGSDIGHATPNARLESVFRDSGFTGTTITWGSLISVAFCDIIIELDTSAAPAGVPNSLMLMGAGI